MSHPYENLPQRAFWRTGTAAGGLEHLHVPKFPVTAETRVATAGSCFAQHIAQALRGAGVNVLDAEPRPVTMDKNICKTFGYGLFSGRYGNIYTARQMVQLLQEMTDGAPDPRFVWAKGRRFVDAFRPTVEPEGLDTAQEVLFHRDYHLERTAQMLRKADVFIFTLGLTECWEDIETKRVFPMCPGTVAGTFDARAHGFRNFTHAEVLADLIRMRDLLLGFNPAMRLLLTVSPVPLTATASQTHVVPATTYSKAVLRAAAGEAMAGFEDVDYFPSFEIITSHALGGPWFGDNKRTVRPEGVAQVMQLFLAAHGLAPHPVTNAPASQREDDEDDDLFCDELLLDAFAK